MTFIQEVAWQTGVDAMRNRPVMQAVTDPCGLQGLVITRYFRKTEKG